MPSTMEPQKRERQYEHIKDSLLERGKGEKTAEEIAARTVNKDRAQHGEKQDREPERRSRTCRRSGVAACARIAAKAGGRSKSSCIAEAAKKNVKGRSRMNKAELERAVGR